MKILLLINDLFRKNSGGGELVYKNIIKNSPNIEFFYFSTGKNKNLDVPKNCHQIKIKDWKTLRFDSKNFNDYSFNFQKSIAANYANSVKNLKFDFIELPDWNCFGSYLKEELNKNNVQYKKLILALHGNISDTLKFDNANKFTLEKIKFLENNQIQAADYIYGISYDYIKYWENRIDKKIYFFDPLQFLNLNQIFNNLEKNDFEKNKVTKPSLFNIGRLEKRKGHEIFIDTLNYLDQNIYDKTFIIGSGSGEYSIYLENLIKDRSLNTKILTDKNNLEILNILNQNTVVYLPVKYDSLNLVALEAILSGCPTIVSNKAGVCKYLDKFYPNISYLKINIDDHSNEISKISDFIKNFSIHRNKNLFEIKKIKELQNLKSNFEKFYHSLDDNLNIISEKTYKKNRFNFELVFPNFILQIAKKFNKLFFLIKKIKLKSFKQNIISNIFYYWLYITIYKLTFKKINFLKKRDFHIQIDRVNFWYNYYKLAKIENNNFNSIVYGLRVLKNLEKNSNYELFNSLLSKVNNLLLKEKFSEEAKVLPLMLEEDSSDLKNLIQERSEALKKITFEDDLEIKIDNRNKNKPKISIIVSLFKAENKMEKFLNLLNQQSVDLTGGKVELILIDSLSPQNELAVYEKFLKINNINSIYFRAKKTETIQKTWNRGIFKSRGEYLVFLGVDEALQANALEKLSNYLDNNLKIDWVVGNTIVMNLDKNNYYKNDVMKHVRNDAKKELTYLETCYTYWVGGMYRKSIHERFGYYDSTFRVAGDTEFKSRILKFINVAYINKNLGIFLNYPDERKSESPLAEIEDLRAWYIYRTVQGLDYQFEKYDIKQLKNFFYENFVYRKSYGTELSYDFNYFYNFIKLINQRSGRKDNEFITIENKLKIICEYYKKLDYLKNNYFFNFLLMIFYILKIKILIKSICRLVGRYGKINNLFHDNSFEQHTRIW